MGRTGEYIAVIKPECWDMISSDQVRSILSAIPNVQITREGHGVFEFQCTREAFMIARNKLKRWCIVQRERFLHDEGGG